MPRPDPEARERRLAGALFFATCCSVFLVRLVRWEGGPWWADPAAMVRALWFTATLMGILLAHELGHYAMARRHGFALSLPWFIPAPVLLGTLGAIIGIREAPRTRTGLLEMGAAGPLAGLAAVLVVVVGRLALGGPAPESAGMHLSTPLLWAVASLVLRGEVVPVSAADPLAFAAWLGCLVTALNLLPFGQLDGGHVLAAVRPDRAVAVGWAVTGALLVGGLWWPGWAVWAALLHLIGARHPVTVRKPAEPPSPRATAFGIACLVAFVLTFTPAPVRFA